MNYDGNVHTADFLRRQAKKLKKETGLPHHVALDEVARSRGYANWKHFCNTMNDLATSAAGRASALGIPIADVPDPATRKKEDVAALRQSSDTESAFSFTQWLAKHRRRDSPLGDLAREAAGDNCWPLTGDIETYRVHLSLHNASWQAQDTLKQAWRTYRAFLMRIANPLPVKPRAKKAPSPKKRPITWVKGATLSHFSKRVAEEFKFGAEAWVSYDGKMALPVIVMGAEQIWYNIRFERPCKRLGISRWHVKGSESTHCLRLDEVRSTPELACINRVTN